MIKNIGIEMSQEIFYALKGQKVVFLTTYSDKGMPHLTPISVVYPKSRESILIALLSDTLAYKNMVWQKKVVLSIIEGNGLVVHIVGRAGVVRAPSHIHPDIHIAQIDVIDIMTEDSLLITIESGVKWKHVSGEMKALHDALVKELQECVHAV